ncbi:MAG: flagellum-specific ATP synthase FliI, partial [Acidobacteriota bacterium]|nr:flagellum-specific ATP synthase FliI [Acidobacteriota bacterium]
MSFNLNRYFRRIAELDPIKTIGTVKRAVGLTVESQGPPVSIGELCDIHTGESGGIPAEVVGFRDNYVISMPLYKADGVKLGDKIICRRRKPTIPVGPALLGRVVNALGEPIDDLGPIEAADQYPIQPPETNPMLRRNIDQPIGTGIRAIDGLLTCG